MQPLDYGKVVHEESYQNGKVATTHRTVHKSIKVNGRVELMQYILQQLEALATADSVAFEVFANKQHEPVRLIVISKEVK